MNNLNSILIEGVFLKDPVLSHDKNGDPVSEFSIASDRYHKYNGDLVKDTTCITIIAEGNLAETCHSRGHKEMGVRVVGRLQQLKWQNAEGQNLSRLVVAAEHIEFRPGYQQSLQREDTAEIER
jgi:single-strand DNA-binding protein